MAKKQKTIELAGRELTLAAGELASQADAAVMASYGETVVLAVVSSSPLSEYPGYFPLSVEYQERLYAGGRIKGSRWVKREGRPSDAEILNARLIDRSIRPLFPKDYQKEVQVVIKVLSVDLENDPDVVSALATSAALAISPIPWQGPVGVVKVGFKNGECLANPKDSELSGSDLDLVVSATADALMMIEAGAKEVPEEKMIEAISLAYQEAKKLINFINDFAKEFVVQKEPLVKPQVNSGLYKTVRNQASEKINDLIKGIAVKGKNFGDYHQIKQAVMDTVSQEEKIQAGEICDELFKTQIRQMIIADKRLDKRKSGEVRSLSSKVGILPRTHGSAIFNRGLTQALTVATLGSPSLEQLIETAEGEETKRYIHHYSMPPYSVGETGRFGSPSRREVGHGALAEKALLPVIPPEEEFPYTIRVVSEILSSNGSTSMASTCGSTLALMDAGVPIKAPVAGIAMGLIISEKKHVILSDITGLEDMNGDMDFKVAGTKDGITALQLDVKTFQLTPTILEEALFQAKKGRLEILESMLQTLAKPRTKVSEHAPKIKVLRIPEDKIGEVIGPGGKMIRKIIAQTGAQIDVEDGGVVNISGLTSEEVEKAVAWIEGLTKEVEVGKIYEDAVVKRIQPFGAFVEFSPGKEGLVHISDMAESFVKDPAQIVKVGDKVKVRVKKVDDFGRINLSMVLQEKQKTFSKHKRPMQRRRSSGPHFPVSRFLDSKKKIPS